MNVTWRISFKKLVYLGLVAVQTVEIIFLTHPDRVFQIWKRKYKFSKGLKISGVSGFWFWAIEPIREDGNDGIFKKPGFSGKFMSQVLFSWVSTGDLDEKFLEVPSGQRIFY